MGPVQIDELIAAFEQHLRCERGYRRSAEYASQIRRLANFLAGSGRTLLQIVPEDLKALRASRPSQASSTFRNGLSALRSFFSWLQENNHVEAVPVLVFPKVAVARLFTPEDAASSKDPAGSLETHASSFLPSILSMLLYHCRLLRSEILAIDVGDIDLDLGLIRIRGTECRSERFISLTGELHELLRRYLTGERGLGSSECRNAQACRPAFLNVNGGALTRQQFSECLRWFKV